MSYRLFQIDAGFQNYEWGNIGSKSVVAQFAHNSNPSKIEIDPSLPYAELWMGTHQSKASVEHKTGTSLQELVEKSPEEFLGAQVINKFRSTREIPFLLKVLSIGKVLSIQAHPDKELAQKLHFRDPKNYPDDNHKPEMALAVTEFEGFCGFKPLEELDSLLQKIPEFREIIGEELVHMFHENIFTGKVEMNSQEDHKNRKLLQQVFSKVMNLPDSRVYTSTKLLVKRTYDEPELFGHDLCKLIQKMQSDFPYDIGLFCGCLMLNHCILQPGEAMFLQARDIHAYIRGDIVECMAASDNVVRAGFTPKFKDVDVLVDMLTYSYEDVEMQKMRPEIFTRSHGDGYDNLYDPPIEEFAVLQTILNKKDGRREVEGLRGPSILIVTKGEGTIQIQDENDSKLNCRPGFIFFIQPEVKIQLRSSSDDFVTYRAFCEVNH
ncbi:BA75_03374T0 [Komagataella pastoris]|uniref:Mannose-6-phosphate isomerase n=1 Tax=Komagataella pastoris TaxID=4922 RepID=A0A1B2JGI9_PICPA|nr:BA75_03374T0 [Komagataella pastoris]